MLIGRASRCGTPAFAAMRIGTTARVPVDAAEWREAQQRNRPRRLSST
ncbi:hypothetical protein C7S16_1937 [Burkholderia thailandensis]|uniref:Uncharacterized protein n=1 Tax=Burkholderia thailandensis TaxID=57975 RepID=A0AAW9D571_BURTH|nr:hypothetical protein [Burkholderia thailandensis]MDW9257165.1 hypothetical protein [Burkholderia thailandensis]